MLKQGRRATSPPFPHLCPPNLDLSVWFVSTKWVKGSLAVTLPPEMQQSSFLFVHQPHGTSHITWANSAVAWVAACVCEGQCLLTLQWSHFYLSRESGCQSLSDKRWSKAAGSPLGHVTHCEKFLCVLRRNYLTSHLLPDNLIRRGWQAQCTFHGL